MSGADAFQFPVRVYWEDTDAGGVVFYANYLKFFERARTEWLRALGISQSLLRETTGGMFVVSETSVRYLRPARLDDELLVTARLQEAGRASLIIAQQALIIQRPTHEGSSAAGPPGQASAAFGIAGARAPLGGSAAALAASVGVIACEGTIRIGWVDAASLQPGRIPSIILESLKKT